MVILSVVLLSKEDFRVDQSRVYIDNTMVVAQLFKPNERRWDIDKIQNVFSGEDAAAIQAINIPVILAMDRIAWSRTTNGKYSIKTGYQLWHARNIGTGIVIQSAGWSNLWKTDLPHKVKLFL